MPGFLVHVGAQVLCSHAGQATPTVPNPRVTVSGQPTVLMTGALRGCRMHLPATARCQWSLCDGAVGERHDTGAVQRAAFSGAEQSGDLCADGNALAHCRNSNACQRFVRPV